jgi:hypothetical protein
MNRSAATAANQVWPMEFVHDQVFDGHKVRLLTVVGKHGDVLMAMLLTASSGK